MAIFSLSAAPIQRSKGQSSVAAAAYISGNSMIDKRTGERHTYTRGQIVDLGSTLPGGAPIPTADLWNEAERVDARKNSRTGRKIRIALPIELGPKAHRRLAEEFRIFIQTEYGAGVTAAVHYDKPDNPHAHFQMTTRVWSESGPGEKIRSLDGGHKGRKEEMEKIRTKWADLVNAELAPFGETVDHRSYKRQGINKIPTKHMGQAASAMESKGIKTEIGSYNQAVYALNKANDNLFSMVGEYDNIKPHKTHTKQIEKCPDWLIVQQKTMQQEVINNEMGMRNMQ